MAKFNNEVLIARIEVENPGKTVILPFKYRRLFTSDRIPTGVTTLRYPITDKELCKDLTQFQKDYPLIRLDITSREIESY